VYGLKATTGAFVWSYDIGGTDSSPAVANGVVYIGSRNQYVFAVNADTGAPVWSYETNGEVESSPVW